MAQPQVRETEILIIGSGVAGAYAALTASALGARVTLVTKCALASGSSKWAQGGIAFPLGLDDIPVHLNDTLVAGRGLSDPEVSNEILTESLGHLQFLQDIGMSFDEGFALEGGHSRARVRHAGGDQSGRVLLEFLHAKLAQRVSILESHFVHQLAVDNGEIIGAWTFNSQMRETFISAEATIIATGGSGQMFEVTTNPPEATGDGVALAIAAGAVVRDLELTQFHPTSLLNGALISEACRGAGALLVNGHGVRFMDQYDELGELAPRDVVARAVFLERRQSGGAFIDLRPVAELAVRFPTVYHSALSLGLDPMNEILPIAPAAHYQMGGIRTDSAGRTSLGRLYAAGEVASTGLHGANRLASNSLLECLVMGARAAIASVKELESLDHDMVSETPKFPGIATTARPIIASLMTEYASVFRSAEGLEFASRQLDKFPTLQTKSVFEAENYNLVVVARSLLAGACERRESRGAHFRVDFVQTASNAFHVDQLLGKLNLADLKNLA